LLLLLLLFVATAMAFSLRRLGLLTMLRCRCSRRRRWCCRDRGGGDGGGVRMPRSWPRANRATCRLHMYANATDARNGVGPTCTHARAHAQGVQERDESDVALVRYGKEQPREEHEREDVSACVRACVHACATQQTTLTRNTTAAAAAEYILIHTWKKERLQPATEWSQHAQQEENNAAPAALDRSSSQRHLHSAARATKSACALVTRTHTHTRACSRMPAQPRTRRNPRARCTSCSSRACCGTSPGRRGSRRCSCA
jgi:hypothetical protein